jgi:hypothetical protein
MNDGCLSQLCHAAALVFRTLLIIRIITIFIDIVKNKTDLQLAEYS